MLEIGLCMTVKDEEANIVACLEPIADLFAQIVVLDTGSTDATCSLLRDRLGIEPVVAALAPCQCFSLAPLRNQGFDMLRTPWVLTLDADERINRAELEAVMALDDADLPDALFLGWDTDMGGGDLVEDYKASLFRKGNLHQGLIHDTVQPSLRETGATAMWTSAMRILHLPDPARAAEKDDRYAWRLACARQRDPDWLRYQWFSGYMAYRQGRLDEASALLRMVHDGRPARFPVESLNASMILASIHARLGRRADAEAVLEDAAAYCGRVRDDFEVAVNFRLPGWLDGAAERAARGDLDGIRPYAFPY
ncbi:MAG: glycosyltransferase [Sphingomonadales bacterium]